MIKFCLLYLLLSSSGFYWPSSTPPEFIDPTGTYILKGVIEKNVIKSHYGELRVKLLNRQLAAVCFYINTGYPDYKSGSFLDTLPYEEDHLQYKPPGKDDCSLFFYFGPQAAEIQQAYADPHSSCGFAKDVIISTFFKKYSDEKPVIQDLSMHGMVPDAG